MSIISNLMASEFPRFSVANYDFLKLSLKCFHEQSHRITKIWVPYKFSSFKKLKWWKWLKLVTLWRSETEVPFLSELQFCSKVEADENQENLREGTPQPILKFRPDLVQYLDATRSESVSPGRFAASRSRYLITFLF